MTSKNSNNKEKTKKYFFLDNNGFKGFFSNKNETSKRKSLKYMHQMLALNVGKSIETSDEKKNVPGIKYCI